MITGYKKDPKDETADKNVAKEENHEVKHSNNTCIRK